MEDRLFRDAMGRFATGITIVTMDDEGKDRGMTVNAFMSISLEPKLIAISIDHTASMYDKLMKADTFGVSVLKDNQQDYSMIFARQKEADGPIPFEYLDGVPVIENSLAALSCKVYKKVEAGDHTIILGEVTELKIESGEPVIFYGGKYRNLQS